MNLEEIKQNLSHVYWIGGSGCAGKTTIADMIADQYGITVYHCDQHWDGEDGHLARAVPDKHPAMCQAREMSAEEFFGLLPHKYAALASGIFKEDFGMILHDLLALQKDRVVVEGVSVEPELVYEVADPSHIIFLIAFEGFQREHFLERNFAQEWFQNVADPEGLFENFIQSNALMAKDVYQQANDLNLKSIIVGSESSIAQNLQAVKEHFSL
jgi:uridine kinase